MKYLLISFAMIPIITLSVFGIDDKNADYFKKGKFITNTEGWEYRYQGVIYPYGLMVSHPSLIVILSIVFGLISWVCYEGISVVVKQYDRKRI